MTQPDKKSLNAYSSHVCTEGKVWDLHIHSNQCASADKELKKLSAADYITKLIDVLEGYPLLEMISFTDHNKISLDVYREFYNRKSRIVLLPGIEIDIALDEGGTAKHLIVYFDAIDDIAKLTALADKLNSFLEEQGVSSHKPIYIGTILDRLVDFKVPFTLSPHAMKQGKRGIDSDWHHLPPEERDTKKFVDQFFCFWEASGHSAIAHAIDFLKQMDCEEKVSIVAFSDSKDFEKLRATLDRPCQYFNSLPNYNGLKMVGSEFSRITRDQYSINQEELGNYIGEIGFAGQRIGLTPRLNTIIGGRGSGKSVLLDALASYLGDGKLQPLERARAEFIATFPIEVRSLGGGALEPGQFGFDYFNQNYISKLFSKTGAEFNKELEGYFGSAFAEVETIDIERIKREIESDFSDLLTDWHASESENIVGFVQKYVVDRHDALGLPIKKSHKEKYDRKLDGFDYSASVEKLDAAIRGRIPSFLKDDPIIEQSIGALKSAVIEQASEKVNEYLNGIYLKNLIIQKFFEKKEEISKAQKDRKEAITLFGDAFESKAARIKKRVEIINAYLALDDGFKNLYENRKAVDGENPQAFLFKKSVIVERPIDCMIRLINDNIKSNGRICGRDNLLEYVEAFCFGQALYKQGSSDETLYEELKKLPLVYTPTDSIHYRDSPDNEYRDISILSPGTQTNVLIEYIVHKETKRPLLIDQPEDNVDNQTIYSKIREWFIELKTKRQVIVVTHDANIVINADAENVIQATQKSVGIFEYTYGALEFGDVIDQASLILDGGKDAVRRRLIKYGD